MAIAVAVLLMLVTILAAYIVLLQLQLRSINRQLDKRLTMKTRQPLTLELMNGELNRLAANINRYLKTEENLRLDSIREEKQFKELIANISHDLRTPLTAIKGYQQLMADNELADEQRNKLAIAQKYADELSALVELFFEYAYLLSAEPQPDRERINLTNLVAECLAAAVGQFEQKHAAVRLQEGAPVFAVADKGMVTRIIQNLIGNCLAHSDGDVDVRLWSSERAAVLSFSNPVKRASEVDVHRLFDRFYTGDKARGRSAGLGLSIVRLLAERLDGSASATLQAGVLEIRVELPLI